MGVLLIFHLLPVVALPHVEFADQVMLPIALAMVVALAVFPLNRLVSFVVSVKGVEVELAGS
jgi:hypothetical protein